MTTTIASQQAATLGRQLRAEVDAFAEVVKAPLARIGALIDEYDAATAGLDDDLVDEQRLSDGWDDACRVLGGILESVQRQVG